MLDLAVQHIKGLQTQVQVCKKLPYHCLSTLFFISMHTRNLNLNASYEYGFVV